MSLEQLIGEKLDAHLSLIGYLRTESSRVILSAEADSDFPKPGKVAVIVDTSEDPEANFKRFSEARFLDHQHVLHAHAVGWIDWETQRRPYVVVDHPQDVLPDILREGSFTSEQLADLVRQVLEALAYLHSENLVFGALNLHSVWKVDGRWQLADFSQLRVPGARPTAETRRLLINREIAAPPEAYYGEITPAWDIWSLGTLLTKIARPVPKNGLAQPRPSPIPLPARVEQIVTSSSMLEPGDRMTAAEMLRLLSRETTRTSKPLVDPTEATSAPTRILPPAPRLPDSEPASRFPWIRLVQGLGIGAGVFAVSLFLTRRSVETRTPPAQSSAIVARAAAPVAASTSALPSRDGAKLEIAGLLGRWASAAREGKLDEQVGCYAGTVDTYFDRRNLSVAELRRDKERALSGSGPLARFDVSGLHFDEMGLDWALVSFDTHWEFKGANAAEGAAREQAVIRRLGGQWKISSEREADSRTPAVRRRAR